MPAVATQTLPLTILAGSDRKPGRLPDSGVGLHALAVDKGASIRLRGRPLIEHLVERARESGAFGPVRLAGPARVYEPLGLGAECIDVDGSVGTNLRAAIELHLERHADEPLALLACDVLPTRDELAELRVQYDAERPCSLWFPFVRRPADGSALGAFGWKPSYPLRPDPDAEPVRVLPGHFGICRPAELRLDLLYRVLDLAYSSRNTDVANRRRVILRGVLGHLLARDLRGLGSLRAPTLTWRVVTAGLFVARRLRGDGLSISELERAVERAFVRREVTRDAARARIRYPLTDCANLAEDVDTEEEAQHLEDWASNRDPGP